MKRGDVWWAVLDQPKGPRPVLLISRQKAIDIRSFVTIVEITTTMRNLRTEVVLGAPDGLPKTCVANADNIGTIAKRRLQRWITTLSPARMSEVDSSLRFALGLDAYFV